ncbi:MAG TPA: phenylalanine--tRNA ligase subunit beta, partial [Terriglobales bacterium]|nr:phenylalanine--tRNA ligase subunit beta [Terriglobales bacterium]
LGFHVTASRGSSVAVSNPVAPPTSGGAHAAVAEEVASFTVEVPTWRLDVEREIDLIEEVARLHGYDNFPNTLPTFSGAVVELPHAAKDAKARSTLLALGYNEAVSLSFISHEDAKRFSSAVPVEIANPLSEEASVMRTSLVPGMLNMLAWNLNRGVNDVRLFESGNVFELNGARAEERRVTCIGATGNAIPANVHETGRPYSFFDLKGDVDSLLSAFTQNSLYFDDQSADYYRPGRSARAVMDGATVARFGQLHPEVAAARKLKQEVFIAEILLDRLYKHALRQPVYKPLARYPAVERDFSFIFDDAVIWDRIRAAVDALHIPELRSFVPAEIFRGGAIPAAKYSLLSRARFQSDERTLREDEVAHWSAQIIQALQALGGTLRAS